MKLKFVAHVGEVAIQKIRRRRKLVGLAVIFVHRLLKNPVPVPEYVLLSEDLYQSGTPARRPDARDLAGPEGIGPVRTYFVKVGDLAGPPARCRILRAPARRRDGCHPRPRSAVQAPPAALTSSRPDSPVRNSCREAQSASLAA